MNTNSPLASLLLISAALGVGGCVTHNETTYKDEPRMSVEFENDTAGRLFYEALSKQGQRGDQYETNTEVSIPIIFEHKTRVVRGENAAFNSAVRRCDTNNDGKITEPEARIFANQK
jgi:hypothetical protein